ncbi:MAG: hypothetical protein ABH879_06335 [archaeon]
MKQVSNTALSILLIVAVCMSIGGTLLSLSFISKLREVPPGITGFAASDTGTANISIIGAASIQINNNIDFGAGTVSSDDAHLTHVDTETTDNYGTFNNCSSSHTHPECRGLEVENDGNLRVNVTMSASLDDDTFFSGNPAQSGFDFFVKQGNRTGGEENSCKNITGGYNLTPLSWTDIPTTARLICGNLSYSDGNDTMLVEFNVTIPTDEPTGQKWNTFTFSVIQVP